MNCTHKVRIRTFKLYCVIALANITIGVTVHTPSGVRTSRVVLLAASADLPARAILMNMKRFNGKFGCLFCEHPGVTQRGNHLHRFWPYRDACPRTHRSLLSDGKTAIINGKPVITIMHFATTIKCTCVVNKYA